MKNMRKKIMNGIIVTSCMILLVVLCGTKSYAQTTYEMYVDAGNGTFYDYFSETDCFNSEQWIAPGTTLLSNGLSVEDPTCAGMQFLGWYGYNKDTGEKLENGRVFTSSEVENYVMPNHAVKFKAEWSGTPITAITYAGLYNATGEVDYNVKITIVNNGVNYSGNGFVTIPESVYSNWTGNIDVYWEFPGEYINANYQYIPDSFSYTDTVSSFKKEKSCYHTIYKTAGEKEVLPKRSVVNDFLTYASTVAPDTAVVSKTTAGNFIDDSTVVPSDYTVTMNRYESGPVYDKAVNAIQSKYESNNVFVYNIELQDNYGALVHQLNATVDVKIQVPADFVLQKGKKVVVYYLTDDGLLEECETVYDDAGKTVTFKTNHFSVYVVAEVEEVKEPENIIGQDKDDERVKDDEQVTDDERVTMIEQEIPSEAKEPIPGENTSDIKILVCFAIGIGVILVIIIAVIFLKKKKK